MSEREMQFNMQVENGGTEPANGSDDGQFLLALRKILREEVEVMVIRTVQQVIVPIFEDLVRKTVKEEIQSVENRLSIRNANEISMSNERCLQLKFSNEVSDPVLTGKPVKEKGGDALKVELVDKATRQVVENGPLSSAKVEILVLDASGDDNDHSWTPEEFNNRIIREGDKKRPHFTKTVYIYLKEGVGDLSNVKLGQVSDWTKSCKCRLGARVMDGVSVQEAMTESFMVSDSRGKLYEKHYPPSLSDEVWRLDNIGRDGAPRKRLNKENVWTVEDFLFLLSVDPQRLQRIVGAGAKKWKATVKHARTCTYDDKMYLHCPSTEPKMGVIFDAVGGLKGIIDNFQYVPFSHLSADEKDVAHKLLLSAFENRKDRTAFDDEASLLQKFPFRSSDTSSPTHSSNQEVRNGSPLSNFEYIDGVHPAEPGTSTSPHIRVSDMIDHDFPASADTGQMISPLSDVFTQFPSGSFHDLEGINCYPPTDPGTSFQSFFTAIGNPHYIPLFGSLESPTMGPLSEPYLGYTSEFSVDNGSLMSIFNHPISNLSKIHRDNEPHSHGQSTARVFPLVIRVLRAKKRLMAIGDSRARKKQRI